MLLANMLLADERLTARRVIGVVLGIAGTAVLVGPGLLANLGGPAWAKFALLGTALAYACAGIFARRFASLQPELVATGQLTAATVITLPLVFAFDDPAALLSAGTAAWSAALALALLATAFAYVIYFSVLASAGASNTSLVTLIVPVSAIILGTLFLGERLEPFEIGGMALIALGLLVIDGRLFKR
jgi:drug/metabolite transporter (DMT)-like permease